MKKRRTYIKGGQYGKIYGFNFYFQKNEKLLKRERQILLRKSEKYIDEIKSNIPYKVKIDYLDYKWTDHELAEVWNKIFSNYGYLISDFNSDLERGFKSFGTQRGRMKEDEPYQIPKYLNSKIIFYEGFG